MPLIRRPCQPCLWGIYLGDLHGCHCFQRESDGVLSPTRIHIFIPCSGIPSQLWLCRRMHTSLSSPSLVMRVTSSGQRISFPYYSWIHIVERNINDGMNSVKNLISQFQYHVFRGSCLCDVMATLAWPCHRSCADYKVGLRFSTRSKTDQAYRLHLHQNSHWYHFVLVRYRTNITSPLPKLFRTRRFQLQ